MAVITHYALRITFLWRFVVENDAVAYGVTVEAGVPTASTRWRWVCERVHHLTAAENAGNHNLFVTLLDEELGRARTRTAWIAWPSETTLEYNVETILQDKPDNEPGGNAPLWKRQVVSCGVNTEPDEVSDVVRHVHTEHPDEPPAVPGGNLGNTLYHHSFLVVLKRTAVQDTTPSDGDGDAGDPDPSPDPDPDPGPDPDVLPVLGDVPERYWGWIETQSHALSLAMYRLNVVVAGRPALAAAAAAGVDELREWLGVKGG
jgi:hypothetical protein